MHQEKVWKKTPAKIGHFGQNDEYLTNFVCTNNSRKSRARINEWDEAFAEVYSKIPQTITAYKLELNDLPDPYFCPYSRQIAEFVKKKRSPVANPEDSRIPSSYFWCENHIQVNWNKNFTFLRTRGKIVKFEKKKCYHLRAAIDVLMVFFVFRGTYPFLGKTYFGSGGIFDFSSLIDHVSQLPFFATQIRRHMAGAHPRPPLLLRRVPSFLAREEFSILFSHRIVRTRAICRRFLQASSCTREKPHSEGGIELAKLALLIYIQH